MKDLVLVGVGQRGRRLITALCVVALLITLFPIYWVIVTSFKTPLAVVGGPTYLPFIDFMPTLQAWLDILDGIRGNFGPTIWSSALVSISAAVVATTLGSMAAYALVRYEFRIKLFSALAFLLMAMGGYLLLTFGLDMMRGKALLLAFVLAMATAVLVDRLPLQGPIMGNEDIVFWFISQRMFPPVVAAFSLYLMYTEMGRMGIKLIDTYWGLTLCYVAFSLPVVVWLMRDFFAALPVEVEEAAMVDNVPSWRIFLGIVVPMSVPGLAATFMITLSFVWNEFLFALFLTNSDWQTLPILVAGQNSQRGDEWWAISAAALVAIIPMMMVAALLGRLMRSGLTLGAIK